MSQKRFSDNPPEQEQLETNIGYPIDPLPPYSYAANRSQQKVHQAAKPNTPPGGQRFALALTSVILTFVFAFIDLAILDVTFKKTGSITIVFIELSLFIAYGLVIALINFSFRKG